MGSPKLLILALLINLNLVHSFNMDLKSPFIFKGNDGSFFGYSLAFNQNQFALMVGAPKSTETNQGTRNWGAVYACKPTASGTCELLKRVDEKGNTNTLNLKDGQWMGATVYSDQKNVLACAPRFSKKDSENGDEFLLGKCDFIDPSRTNNNNDYIFNPCGDVASRLTEYRMCAAGFAGKLAGSTDSLEIFAGAPPSLLSKGGIAVGANQGQTMTFTTAKRLNFSDYMGYAVTTGKFKDDKKTTIIVGGAPRGDDLSGKVLMYEANDGYNLFSSTIQDPSEPPQPGSYFGSALGAADIDGDGFSDLVVGAPQYANTEPNQGAVYVYLNNGKNGLTYTKQHFIGKDKDGFFGYSIGSVGDLNNDAMQEIAVGAPWGGDDGKGIVFLYYGTKNKENPLVLKQTIRPSDITGGAGMDGFGFSFADLYQYSDLNNDFDNNKYNEIAIGAYRSSQAVVLRARPVITISGTISLGSTSKIDLYSKDPNTICTGQDGKQYKCIKDVEVCFQIPGSEGQLTVSYNVNLDAEQVAAKRGFFEDNGNEVHSLKKTITVDKSEKKCAPKLTIFLKNNTKDVLRPFGIELTWEYEETICNTGEICPIANAMLELSSFTKIPYIKGCSDDGNDICNSDLAVTMSAELPDKGTNIAIGVTKTVTINVDIKNKRENAFLSTLELQYPPQVSPNKVSIKDYPGTVDWLPDVTADSDQATVRVTLSSPIKRDAVEKVSIVFSVLNVGTDKSVTFTATAKTKSQEMFDEDNTDTLTLSVSLSANLTVSGNVFPENIKWKKAITDPKTVGPKIKHTFFFQNMGPSAAQKSDIEIKIPEKVGNDYILNINKVNLEPGVTVQGTIGTCKYGALNPLKLDLIKTNNTQAAKQTTRRRREATPTAVYECGGGAECKLITCELNELGKSQSVTVTVESTLVEATFDKIKESRQVIAYAKFSSEFVKRPGGAAPDEIKVPLNVNSPYFKIEKAGDPIPWWVILLCILGAVLIIGIIVFILYKKGFFKRKNKREQEEEEELRKGDPDDDY